MKGSLNGKLVRASLGTSNWQVAAERIAEIEATGTLAPRKAPITVAEAVVRYLKEAESRELRDATMKKFRNLLSREPRSQDESGKVSPSLVTFAKVKRLELLRDFTPDDVADFRQAWTDRGLSKLKKSERLKAFFRSAHEAGWIPTNPARGLKPPKAASPTVVAFSKLELDRIMSTCSDVRLTTFILVMRYTGLAIADAVQLKPSQLEGAHLTLRRTKTGQPVRVLLPAELLRRLHHLPLLEGGYFFWNRKMPDSIVATATGNMRRALRRIFRAAGLPAAHPHQFRHTFVRQHLEADVSVETIADLLGNSVMIIEKHYSNWVSSRQKKLDEAVQRTWDEVELNRFAP